MKKDKKLASGMAIGMAAGTLVGFFTDNVGLWLCIGLAIGAGVGSSLMKKGSNNNNDAKGT
jgi:hypothetical protein